MSEIAVATRSVGVGRVRRQRPSWLIGLCFVVLGVVAVMACFGQWLTPQDPAAQDLTRILQQPSGEHWLGTDTLGRDIFSRIVVGTRSAVVGPVVITIGGAVLGSLLGLFAGFRGGIADALIMRWVDLQWTVPAIFILIVVAGSFGGSYWLAIAVLTVLSGSGDTRMIRGATLEQLPRPYIEAARALGVRNRRIMLAHILPNVSAIIVANVFLGFTGALLLISGLSFLGLGVPPGTPDWGLMLAEHIPLLFSNAVATLAPAVMIVLTAVTANLVGDWLYERMTARGATR